jgi:hypothetical protein
VDYRVIKNRHEEKQGGRPGNGGALLKKIGLSGFLFDKAFG